MGCTPSVFLASFQQDEVYTYRPLFGESLGMTFPDMRFLQLIFEKLDPEDTGKISMSELLNYVTMKDTVFIRRCFSIFDTRGSRELTFFEFVMSIYNLCALNTVNFPIFVFDMYGSLKNDSIEKKRMSQIVKEGYARDFDLVNNELSALMIKDLRGLSKATYTLKEFREFCQANPSFMNPLTVIARDLRVKIIGEEGWAVYADVRLRKVPGKLYVKIQDCLRTVNPKHSMFRKLGKININLYREGVATATSATLTPFAAGKKRSTTKRRSFDNLESFKEDLKKEALVSQYMNNIEDEEAGQSLEEMWRETKGLSLKGGLAHAGPKPLSSFNPRTNVAPLAGEVKYHDTNSLDLMRKLDGKEYAQQQLGFYDITADGLKRKGKSGKMGKDLPTNNAISPYHESILANVNNAGKKDKTVGEGSAKKAKPKSTAISRNSTRRRSFGGDPTRLGYRFDEYHL